VSDQGRHTFWQAKVSCSSPWHRIHRVVSDATLETLGARARMESLRDELLLFSGVPSPPTPLSPERDETESGLYERKRERQVQVKVRICF
jgi:hypothetical protein